MTTPKKKPGDANKAELLMLLRSLVPAGHVETEYRFHPVRMWRFDFAIPALMLAAEYDGINTFGGHQGRHTSLPGVTGDHEKLNTATLLGWRVVRFTKLHFAEKDRRKHKLKSPYEVIKAAIGEAKLGPGEMREQATLSL